MSVNENELRAIIDGLKTIGAKRLEHEPDTTPRMAAVMELMNTHTKGTRR